MTGIGVKLTIRKSQHLEGVCNRIKWISLPVISKVDIKQNCYSVM